VRKIRSWQCSSIYSGNALNSRGTGLIPLSNMFLFVVDFFPSFLRFLEQVIFLYACDCQTNSHSVSIRPSYNTIKQSHDQNSSQISCASTELM